MMTLKIKWLPSLGCGCGVLSIGTAMLGAGVCDPLYFYFSMG